MALPVALQLYTVRDDFAAGYKATLKKVAEMGYAGVEFAGFPEDDPKNVKALLYELGLTAVSSHVPFVDMLADTEKIAQTLAVLGAKYVAVPYTTPEYRPDGEKFGELIEEINRMGKIFADYGIQLLYHNHDFEFVMVGEEYGLDVLYASVAPELLQTGVDTCWVKVAGLDPAGYVKKYTGRAPVVHLKDFQITGKLPKKLYALIGLDEDEEDDGEESSFEFRPAGHGMQNMPEVVAAAEAAGAKWVVVEQDEPAAGQTRMESAQISREYLKSIGW